MRTRRTPLAVVAILVSLTPGCYLAHIGLGQARLMRARTPIANVLADPATPAPVRERLELVSNVRAFASKLGLEVGDQYTSYAPWPGDRIVTALVATRPGEIEPYEFWFPLVGHVPYKGYFDRERAQQDAREMEAEGFTTCLSAVPAYSTLGWFEDPVTGPMLRGEESELVETLVHELVHRTVYARNAADFNEGIATFVGQEGRVQFFQARDGPSSASAARARAFVIDDRAISAALEDARGRVERLYRTESAGPKRDAARAAIEMDARVAIAGLALTTQDPLALARDVQLGDACLALEGTYTRDLTHYAEALVRAGDLPTLIVRAKQAALSADPRRTLWDAP
ncbi:MAG TPA: aminopeptidase [Myxococcota bacterium]|nr:aminopeptidase [Myxococcota bacterium]